MKRLAIALSSSAVALVAAGSAAVWFGAYDISASDQHLAPTYWLLDAAMRRGVAVRARDVRVPPLDGDALWRRGLALYDRHCTSCHGAPGVAPEPFALGMKPVPANLAHTAREWTPAELYWTVRHGIKMTGMPAWEFRMSDDDLWAVVAFVRRMPDITPNEYGALLAQARSTTSAAGVPHDDGRKSDPQRGMKAIEQHACVTCHRIPGVVGANAPVGPPLDGVASRELIAGRIANTPANMVRWLMSPKSINPESAMPDLGVDARDARDIAAYLGTLR